MTCTVRRSGSRRCSRINKWNKRNIKFFRHFRFITFRNTGVRILFKRRCQELLKSIISFLKIVLRSLNEAVSNDAPQVKIESFLFFGVLTSPCKIHRKTIFKDLLLECMRHVATFLSMLTVRLTPLFVLDKIRLGLTNGQTNE